MKRLFSAFLILPLLYSLIHFVEFGEESVVASDGDFLFYNNPVSVNFHGKKYIAFVNSGGGS